MWHLYTTWSSNSGQKHIYYVESSISNKSLQKLNFCKKTNPVSYNTQVDPPKSVEISSSSRWTLNLGLAINKHYTLKNYLNTNQLSGENRAWKGGSEREKGMKQPEGRKRKKKKKKTQAGIDLEDK